MERIPDLLQARVSVQLSANFLDVSGAAGLWPEFLGRGPRAHCVGRKGSELVHEQLCGRQVMAHVLPLACQSELLIDRRHGRSAGGLELEHVIRSLFPEASRRRQITHDVLYGNGIELSFILSQHQQVEIDLRQGEISFTKAHSDTALAMDLGKYDHILAVRGSNHRPHLIEIL